MIRKNRSFIAIWLALLLVLTAQSMAVARGLPGSAGSVVLCTGTGPVTILIDAEGQPIGHAHVCPDCTLSLIVTVGHASPLIKHPMGRAEALILPPAPVLPPEDVKPFSARDPPVLV